MTAHRIGDAEPETVQPAMLAGLRPYNVVSPLASYRKQLLRRRNPYRWLECSLSASIMIVFIAMLVGINDIAALAALVGVNASMIGFGWIRERYEAPGAGLGPFWIARIRYPTRERFRRDDRHRGLGIRAERPRRKFRDADLQTASSTRPIPRMIASRPNMY